MYLVSLTDGTELKLTEFHEEKTHAYGKADNGDSVTIARRQIKKIIEFKEYWKDERS